MKEKMRDSYVPGSFALLQAPVMLLPSSDSGHEDFLEDSIRQRYVNMCSMGRLSAALCLQRSLPGTGWDLSSQFHRSSFMQGAFERG